MNRYFILCWVFALAACQKGEDIADAYGNFEADEVYISAEMPGRITSMYAEEGDEVKKGAALVQTDTVQLHLQAERLKASMDAIYAKMQDVGTQLAVYEEQKANLTREVARLKNLVADNAAPQKQLDDLTGELDVVEKRIKATSSQLNTANRGLLSELKPMKVQLVQIQDQIQRCTIESPLGATVLAKYAENGELATAGRPLYKVASLKEMIFRAYISETQLANIQVGQSLQVIIDQGEGEKLYKGQVVWVSAKAEFTPKEVQTKEERVNLIYAMKVKVPNDGALKIGMPGEIRL